MLNMEENGIWKESFKMHYYMVDAERLATMTTLFNLFQEVAGNHAIFRKLGNAEMEERGQFWVLNRFKVEMQALPQWLETIEIHSWVSAMRPSSNRHFLIFNQQKELIGSAYAIWVLLDGQTHRPIRVGDHDVLCRADMQAPCGIPGKLQPWEPLALSTNIRVKYSDLDMSSHVNNVHYVSWIMDEFALHENPSHVRSLEINYLGETFLNEKLNIFSGREGAICHYSVRRETDNQEICRARLGINKEV